MNDSEMVQRLGQALDKLKSDDPGGEMVLFTQDQAEALIRISEHLRPLTKEQADALISFGTWWIRLQGAGALGGVLMSGIKWFAFVVGAWIALKAGLIQWIADNIGGGK